MQPIPEYLPQLISLASAVTGSDYALAKTLEVTRQQVSDWKHGRKPAPLADVVLMAEIAGLKSEEWIARALVAQYEGTAKGDKLYRALRKSLVATGAAIVSAGASAHQIFSHDAVAQGVGYFIRCIERLTKPERLPLAF